MTETVDIAGSKTWDDKDDQDGKRPASITINLLADGEEVAEKTVTAEDDWAWSFEGLDKYSKGVEIVYTITEDEIEGYTSVVDGYNVTNTHIPSPTPVPADESDVEPSNENNSEPASEDNSEPASTPDNEPTTEPQRQSSEESSDSLPATGQLWWPIPVLALLGIAMIFIGIMLLRKKKIETSNN